MAEISKGGRSVGVAIMGYGVVGKGVAHAIRSNRAQIMKRAGFAIELLHVLDILDFPDSPDAAIMTRDIDDILNDGDVRVVVETMGGIKAAYAFSQQALARQKHVVTSNKELVAEYGPELLALADKNGVSYRFDASVGGGIPAIVPLRECLAANNMREITGILNGTTNYMLTYMRTQGARFAETLKMAQEEGYAEKDPTADIEGADACRKLAILSSIAWDAFLDWKSIHTEGIANVAPEDIDRAADFGCALKLIARACRREDGAIEACVLPAMIDKRSPLACVDGVNNGILASGDLTGDVMLFGRGAGMLPTGSAVVSDVIKAAGNDAGAAVCLGAGANPKWDRGAASVAADFSNYVHGFYARVETPDPDAYINRLFREFPEARILPPIYDSRGGAAAVAAATSAADAATKTNADGKSSCAFTIPLATEGEFSEKLGRVNDSVKGSATCFVARFFDTRNSE
ncbi:MAG: homoserine dehydrogenase [Oscillospiraceae bacterium]|nr:homoserine dehydrogenase [Oscillospiraceae bacterium]